MIYLFHLETEICREGPKFKAKKWARKDRKRFLPPIQRDDESVPEIRRTCTKVEHINFRTTEEYLEPVGPLQSGPVVSAPPPPPHSCLLSPGNRSGSDSPRLR